MNAGLGLALVMGGWSSSAFSGSETQPARQPRDAGRYTVVSGTFIGGIGEAMYILDAENRELASVVYDPASRTVRLAGYRDLGRDAVERPGR